MTSLWSVLRRKLAVMLLVAISAIGAYAALGDGRAKPGNPRKSLLSDRPVSSPGTFSLRSGYSYRGNQVINTNNKRYMTVNTTVTIQKGRTAYTVPLQKKMLLDNKVTFNPNAATRR
jgi:hypothetical protein